MHFFRNHKNSVPLLCLLISSVLLSSCATRVQKATDPLHRATAYLAPDDPGKPFFRFSPVFLAEESRKPHNRIGTAAARINEAGEEEVFVDPDAATIYIRKQQFTTENGDYTNLIYRINFQKVPCGLIDFNLTCGSNVGLFVYITLNEEEQPVLITTVHTCGCYLGFVPTSYLAPEMYPPGWDTRSHYVYGELLPGLIDYEKINNHDNTKLIIRLKKDTHRVMGMDISDIDTLADHFILKTADYRHADSLLEIPLQGGHTSFFEMSGCRKGYVKNSHKPFERLLMSWWAFDWYIGEDKRLGPEEKTGNIFYTSLKFWAREESNIWDFAAFLRYWGWSL